MTADRFQRCGSRTAHTARWKGTKWESYYVTYSEPFQQFIGQ